MRYAETGFNLEIDLSRGNVERVETTPDETEKYLGGLGTNAKIMWERVPPETDPFDEQNLLIFGTGLLVGTPVIGANRTIVTSISPQTRLLAFSMMGGFWGPELKFAGYDKVIIRGKAPELSYIWIKDGQIEIRDATHLAGTGSVEVQDLIREELGEPKAQVSAIGLAGENKIFFASIEQGKSSASRGGLGAVMGAKNIKAIAVRGTGDLQIARPDKMIPLVQYTLDFIRERNENPIKNVMPIMQRLGSPQEMAVHDEKWHTENFTWGNARVRRKGFWNEEVAKDWTDTLENYRTRLISCFGCPMKCAGTVSIPGQPTYLMKCFSKLTYTMAAFSDLDFGLRIARLATEHGVDGFSAPQVMAYALELLEAGILTEDDFEGAPEPEDVEGRFYWLLERIVHREGIGDTLADGTYWASEKIGKGAMEYAHNNIRKHEQLPLKLGMMNPIYFLMYSTGEKANITQIEGNFPQAPFPTREMREEFAKDWVQAPNERMKEYFLNWEIRGEFSIPNYPPPDAVCEIVDWQERMHYIDDAVGMCAGLSSFPYKPPYHIHNWNEFIAAAAGVELSEEEVTRVSQRIRNLVRAVNIRLGLTPEDEKPPEDHWKRRFPDLEQNLLDTYFAYRGWNEAGVPTAETLTDLGLEFVRDEFFERGILSAEEEV